MNQKLANAVDIIRKHLSEMLTDDDRLAVFGIISEGYCEYCGCIDPNNRCQCWNDE